LSFPLTGAQGEIFWTRSFFLSEEFPDTTLSSMLSVPPHSMKTCWELILFFLSVLRGCMRCTFPPAKPMKTPLPRPLTLFGLRFQVSSSPPPTTPPAPPPPPSPPPHDAASEKYIPPLLIVPPFLLFHSVIKEAFFSVPLFRAML